VSKVCEHCGSALPEFGGIVCDDDRAEIRFRGKFIRNLTSQEFTLFRILIDANGRTIRKENLLEMLYANKAFADADLPEIKIIDVFICKLRKKLVPLGIEVGTTQRRGYFLMEPANG
jgi:DNA-binding response OmpR family regulator